MRHRFHFNPMNVALLGMFIMLAFGSFAIAAPPVADQNFCDNVGATHDDTAKIFVGEAPQSITAKHRATALKRSEVTATAWDGATLTNSETLAYNKTTTSAECVSGVTATACDDTCLTTNEQDATDDSANKDSEVADSASGGEATDGTARC